MPYSVGDTRSVTPWKNTDFPLFANSVRWSKTVQNTSARSVQGVQSLFTPCCQEHADGHLSLAIIKSVDILRKLQVLLTQSASIYFEVPRVLSGYLTKNVRLHLY